MTELQRQTMSAVRAVHPRWYRAAGSGQRVTLANLWRHHDQLERRAWRGNDGEANAAYEYRLSERGSRTTGVRYVPQADADTLLINAVAGQIAIDYATERRDIPTGAAGELDIGERVLAILADNARLRAAVAASRQRRGTPVAEIVAVIRRVTAGRL